MKLIPEEDGITHINVYSKGLTDLGRNLSNFSKSVIITEDGRFSSIEGYWYWLGTNHPKKDELRDVYGFKAKALGREFKGLDWQDSIEFKRKIKSAIYIKLHTFPFLAMSLKDNRLPLTHYYVYGGKVVNVPEAEWILDILREFKND